MTAPQPAVTVKVDPCNPGQFFACCGLLELADRLWGGAEGWFAGGEFRMACAGTLADLVRKLAQTEIGSSLSPAQRKRLGTLLSLEKAKLTPEDVEDKELLRQMWKLERLHLYAPFDFWVDWWRDEQGERTALKTWAAKQMVFDMAEGMLAAVKSSESSRSPDPDDLFQPVRGDSLPFNFDSDLAGDGSARDAGFSPGTLKSMPAFRPLLELAAFVGLQRFRPVSFRGTRRLRYCLWSTPLPPPVAAAAATGTLQSDGDRTYEFRMYNRTKYMKAFLPAQLREGDDP